MTHGHPATIEQRPRRRASRRMTAATLLATTALVAFGVSILDGGGGPPVVPGMRAADAAVPREDGVGTCLRLAAPAALEGDAIVGALVTEARQRPHLFPATGVVSRHPSAADASTIVAVLPLSAPARPDAALATALADGICGEPGQAWSFTVTHDLLADGADRLVQQFGLPDGWDAAVEVDIHAADSRVRSTLRFSGPMGIGGSCWIDETLGVDDGGAVTVETTSGADAGFAGMVACSRFEAELSEGGAGAQALALLPSTLVSGADASLRADWVRLSPSRVSVGAGGA